MRLDGLEQLMAKQVSMGRLGELAGRPIEGACGSNRLGLKQAEIK